jgi:hypothetical protein
MRFADFDAIRFNIFVATRALFVTEVTSRATLA